MSANAKPTKSSRRAARNDPAEQRLERARNKEMRIIAQMAHSGAHISRAAWPAEGDTPGGRGMLALVAALAAGTWQPQTELGLDLARAGVDGLSKLLEPLIAAWDEADRRLAEAEQTRKDTLN